MGKPAARISDAHICPEKTGHTPHVGGPVVMGVPTVFVGGALAATIGSICECNGPPDTIVMGSASVFIGGKPAARMGDSTAHGGVIVMGCPTVLIGDSAGNQETSSSVSKPDKVSAQWRLYSALHGAAHEKVPYSVVFDNSVVGKGTTHSDGTMDRYFNENNYKEVEIWVGESGWSLLPEIENEELPAPLDIQYDMDDFE